MKVLFLNSVYRFGSTGKICFDLQKGLIESGNSSIVCYGRGGDYSDQNGFLFASKFDNYADAFSSRLFDNQGFNSYLPTKRLIKEIRSFSPDIIHIHNLHGYYLNLPVLFSFLNREYQGKIVWTLHDCWPFTGHCAFFDANGCDEWKTGCEKCPAKRSYPKAFFSNSAVNWNKKKSLFDNVPPDRMMIVTPSKWLQSFLEFSILRKFKSIVIHNGVDDSVFRPTKEKQNNPKIILGVASVWDKRKGLDDFVELSRVLPPDYTIVLVGAPKDKAIPVAKNIAFYPRVSSSTQLASFYSSATFFFNPTHEDNYPTTNLEAFSCGTKVVTYRTGGSAEPILTPAFVVNSPRDFVDKIRFLEKTSESHVDVSLSTFIKSYLALYNLIMEA